MPGPTFRLARLPDADAIALMSRELIEAGLGGWSWDPQRVARAIRARDTVVLVAAAQNSLIGFAIMNFGDASAHLSLLAVQPSHQRRLLQPRHHPSADAAALVRGLDCKQAQMRAGIAEIHDGKADK